MGKKTKLNKMTLSPQVDTKIRGKSQQALTHLSDQDEIAVVIKVKQADYVPAQVREVARVSPVLFTGRIRNEGLAALEQDPNVISVEISQNLKGI